MDHTTNPSLADMASSLQTASCGYIHHDATLEGSQTVTWTPHSIFTAHFPSTLTRAKWPDFAELPKSRSSIYKLGRHQNDSRCGTWGRVLREPDRIDRQNGKKHVFFASIRRASETTSPKAPAASFPPETINWKLLRSEAEAAPRMTEKPEPMMRRSAFCSLPTFCPNWLEWRVKENPAYPTSPHVKKTSKLPCATRVRTLRQIKKPFIVLADLLDNQGITLIPRFDAGMYFYCPNPNCHPHTPRYTP